MIDVAIFGATGYGGQELLRYLAVHPEFRVAAAASGRFAGRAVPAALPQCAGFYDDLVFQDPTAPLPDGVAAAFLAVPHGAARDLALRLPRDLKIVDLSMDFRDESDGFVYGFPEANRDRIRAATRVANPGCFATGALLALLPFAPEGDVVLAQTTGSSGSGAHGKPGTHHPERAQDQRAYKVLSHQHEAEIAAQLARQGAGDVALSMIPQSGPFSRGIFTVAHFRGPADAAARARARFADEPFARVVDGSPALRHVARTNFGRLAVHERDGRVAVLSAIDNLGKGMAGQAIQNLNLMCGLDETAGLLVPGANP